MTRVKLNQPVRYNGKITTIAELADQCKIEFKEVKSFFGGRKMKTAYFADIKGTTEGWEINKFAYLSRKGKHCKV